MPTEGQKYRRKKAIIGLSFLAVGFLLEAWMFTNYSTIVEIQSTYGFDPLPPLGVLLLFVGVGFTALSLRKVEYVMRPCPNCGVETQQFVAEFTTVGDKRESPRRLASITYTCEKCHRRIRVPYTVTCPICKEQTSYSKSSVKSWGGAKYIIVTCDQCQKQFIEYKKESFPIPICETCGKPMEVYNVQPRKFVCRADDKVVTT